MFAQVHALMSTIKETEESKQRFVSSYKYYNIYYTLDILYNFSKFKFYILNIVMWKKI